MKPSAGTADSTKNPGFYTDFVTSEALATCSQIHSTFAKAYKAGVKIAFSPDAVVYQYGKNWIEFDYMIEASMSAMETIKTATIGAAKLPAWQHTDGLYDF